MSTVTITPALEAMRDALAALPGVQTCRIGIEDNITPDDYPIIRLVPSKLSPFGEVGYRHRCEAHIYYGAPIQPFDDAPDSAGRVRLEKLYAALFEMDAAIREILYLAGWQCFETTLDEDRLETYKLMAVRCLLIA